MIFTVGHGARTLSEFVAALKSGPVHTLVDVRRFPGSRRHPHFGRAALEEAAALHGFAYEWQGEELGGRREKTGRASRHPAWRNDSFQAYADYMDTDSFRAAVIELERREQEGIAVMCAETLWWKCHRRLIADALSARGTDVVHLIDADQRQPHKLHPNLRIGEDGWPVYDLSVDLPLDLSSDPEGRT